MDSFKQCTIFMTPFLSLLPAFPHIFVLSAVSSLFWYPALEARHDGLCLLKKKKVCRWVIYEQNPPWVMAHCSFTFHTFLFFFGVFFFFYTAPDTCKETSALHTLPLPLQLKTCYSSTLIYSWLIQGKAKSLSAIWRLSYSYVHKVSVKFKMLSKPE